MPLRGVITYVNSPQATAKELRPAVKEGSAAAVEHWHDVFTPQHFETKAVPRYKYQPRKAKYRAFKRRRYRHDRPLVLTGAMRRQVLRMIKVSATSKGARGVVSGPKYLYQYRRDADEPDKAAELTAVTEIEVLELAKVADKTIQAHLDRMHVTETKVI